MVSLRPILISLVAEKPADTRGFGLAASQVLKAPAVGCALGRAVSLVIDEQSNGAELRLSYSQGQVVSLLWSEDHCERTEYGQR